MPGLEERITTKFPNELDFFRPEKSGVKLNKKH